MGWQKIRIGTLFVEPIENVLMGLNWEKMIGITWKGILGFKNSERIIKENLEFGMFRILVFGLKIYSYHPNTIILIFYYKLQLIWINNNNIKSNNMISKPSKRNNARVDSLVCFPYLKYFNGVFKIKTNIYLVNMFQTIIW